MATVKLDLSRDDQFSDTSQRLDTSDRVLSPSTIPPSTTIYSGDRTQGMTLFFWDSKYVNCKCIER